MMRLSNYEMKFRRFSIVALLSLLLPFLAKADFGITLLPPTPTQISGEYKVDVIVYDFEDILSLQLSFQWDTSQFSDVDVVDISDEFSFPTYDYDSYDEGFLGFKLSSQSGDPLTLPDCAFIFSIKLKANSSQFTPPNIGNFPLATEVIASVNGTEQPIPLTQNLNCTNIGQLFAGLNNDSNKNCVADTNEYSIGLTPFNINIEKTDGTFNRVIDQNTSFLRNYVPVGEYQVSLTINDDAVWSVCEPEYTVNVLENQTTNVNFQAHTELGISTQAFQVGNNVRVDFLVHNFVNISFLSFRIEWPVIDMNFDSLISLDLQGGTNFNFGTGLADEGKLFFDWYNANNEGVTLPPCSRILSLSFSSINGVVPPIQSSSNQNFSHAENENGVIIIPSPNYGCTNAISISGDIFNDEDDNCSLTIGEAGLNEWKVQIENDNSTYYSSTKNNGNYIFYGLPGSYEISLVPPQNNLWETCTPAQTVNLTDSQPAVVNFAAQALLDCPQLTVDLGAPFLRRCFESTYNLQYCNDGTIPAEDAQVELTLDPYLGYVSSSIPFASQNGQTLTFPIGDVAVGQCGSFSVTVMVSCDAELGQTHCTEAHIFPDDICEPVNPLWDGSLLDVTGSCDGDSVRFLITNNGADMAQPAPFIVIEDDMINFEGPGIQLGAGQSYAVAVPANGSTWRVALDDADTNPFNGSTAVSVEGCGVNGSGSFSLGFVTQFPQGDESPFIDTDCQPNVGSYDPNDKTGYPNGYCAAHFIEPNQAIEYQIRFQNTGTDTAFTVVVTDTLPLPLDPTTVQPGASSHPYDFELLGNGVVRFTFNDIMLPDSNVNESGSHGYVRFTVAQDAANPNGTVISNQAGIVFDFNDPVFTNIYTHTVADDFVQSAGADGNLSVSGRVSTWYGAPVEDVEVTLVPTCPVYTASDGNFEFLELDTADYTLLASKPNLNKQEGVTVLDYLTLPSLVLNLAPNVVDFPYQYLAASLNGSGQIAGLGGITTFDLANFHRIVLGMDAPTLANNWLFVDANHVFQGPVPPFAEAPPTTVQLDQLSENKTGVDMVAIKPGNILHEPLLDSSLIAPYFYLVANPFANGEVEVELRSNGLNSLNGFQFGIVWDANMLAFERLDTAKLGALFNATVPGQLQLMSLAGSNADLPDSTILFKLVFRAANASAFSEIALDESLLPFQVVVEGLKLAGATFGNTSIGVSSIGAEPDNEGFFAKPAPNPVRTGHPIFIETNSETAQSLNLRIFDTSGKMVQSWAMEVQPGRDGFSIQPNLPKGAYFFNISNNQGEQKNSKLIVY